MTQIDRRHSCASIPLRSSPGNISFVDRPHLLESGLPPSRRKLIGWYLSFLLSLISGSYMS